MSEPIEVTLSGLPTRTYLRFEPLSNLELTGDQRDVSDEYGNVAVSGFLKGSRTTKPSGALPIGLYEYFPDEGVFAPAYFRWEDKPRRGKSLRKYEQSTERTMMAGVWGIRHLVPDRTVWNMLGTAVEMVLANSPRPEVVKLLAEIARRALGNGSYQAFKGEEIVWNYPPLIQVVYDLSQAEIQGSSPKADAPSERVDAPALAALLAALFYDSESPLFKGVSLRNVVQYRPITDSPTSGMEQYTHPDLVMQPGDTGTQMERLMTSGASDGSFKPHVYTALVASNSTRNLTDSKALLINAVSVMSNDPEAFMHVTPDKEFPFDFDKKEIKELQVEIIEGAEADPKHPDHDPDDILKGSQLPGRYGKILISSMNAKTRRGKTFSKAMSEALTGPGSIARVRPLAQAMSKIVKMLLRTKL